MILFQKVSSQYYVLRKLFKTENLMFLPNSATVLPTEQQQEWADCEIGVIIHLDVQVFEPSYSFRKQPGYTPAPSVFNPSDLDTDQWLDTAKSCGAKYAVLVTKHFSGFSLWPTGVHGFSVASSPWRKGRGDVVGDFFRSCERHDIKPGLYYNAAYNAYGRVYGKGRILSGRNEEQRAYNSLVEKQLSELWSCYGNIFELWFDGGLVPPHLGGPEIIPLLEKYQPRAVVFQGPPGWPGLIRWVGNERGEAPYPCWSRTDMLSSDDGMTERADMAGSAYGAIWAPAESDMPNRDQNKAFMGGWFWREGEDSLLYSLDHLVERYYTSVGRNTNLLLGMVIDNRGLVPDADRKRFAEFGREIERRFGRPLCSISGKGTIFELSPFSGPFSHAVIMEDISRGENILRYAVEILCGKEWLEVTHGFNVGHKRIEKFPPVYASKARLVIRESITIPVIRNFALFR